MTLRPHPEKKNKTLKLALFIVNMPEYALKDVCSTGFAAVNISQEEETQTGYYPAHRQATSFRLKNDIVKSI